jgi:hypothetical protein
MGSPSVGQRSLDGRGCERLEPLDDAVVDVVADPTHDLERLPGRVGDGPVLVPPA